MLMRVEDLVVLYSGGADSTLLLRMAESMGKKPFALMIDYGQLHIKELEFAKKFCDEIKVPYTTVELKNYNVRSGLTTGEKGIYEGVSVYNVPARNSIFLTIAAGIAESKKIDTVWIGCDYSDRLGLFKDCYQEYFVKVNEMFSIAFSYPIKVEAPLIGFSKQMVLKMLEKSYNVTTKDLFSGYGQFS